MPGGSWKFYRDVIRGTSPATEKRHGLLVTNDQYEDFVAKLDFKVTEGDSGFYFRVEETGSSVGVAGIQVEVDNIEPGGLYETGGRGWIIKKKPAEVAEYYRPREWNSMVVIAQGADVTVFINGQQTSALHNDTGRRSGHLALQLHGGQAMHVEYRNIRLRKLGPKDNPWSDKSLPRRQQ